jgi:hypothetical protein
MQIFNFDTKHFTFKEEIEKIFQTNNLETLYKTSEQQYDVLIQKTDQQTHWHKTFYANIFKNNFIPLYTSLVKEVIKPKFFGEQTIIYQKVPTFRIHLPNNVGVGAFHKDRDYKHSKREINFLLPFTRMFSTNSVWIESYEDNGDFQPITMKYGNILMFDGSNLTHGSKINETDICRLSVDFRIVPLAFFREIEDKTVNKGMELKLGQYWDTI